MYVCTTTILWSTGECQWTAWAEWPPTIAALMDIWWNRCKHEAAWCCLLLLAAIGFIGPASARFSWNSELLTWHSNSNSLFGYWHTLLRDVQEASPPHSLNPNRHLKFYHVAMEYEWLEKEKFLGNLHILHAFAMLAQQLPILVLSCGTAVSPC